MREKAGKYKILTALLILILGVVSCVAFLLSDSLEAYASVPGGYDKTTKVGDTVSFGEYQWRVLDIQNGKALILSDTVIVGKAYHEEQKDITWEGCTLRQYLNDEFYDSFSAEEKARIAETTVSNNNNPWYGTNGGNATKDRIFILSVEEVVQYFGDSGQLRNRPSNNVPFINDQYNSERIVKDANGTALFWWLRSPGYFSILAALVYLDGRLVVYGLIVNCSNTEGGARPALWLNL